MVFHNQDSYFTTLTPLRAALYVSTQSYIGPLNSRVRQSLWHTHHRNFIDFRHITNHISYFNLSWQVGSSHFCTNLTWLFLWLRSASADFTELLTPKLSFYDASRSIKEYVSGRYSIIPYFEIAVLHKGDSFMCLIFKACALYIRNGSHPGRRYSHRWPSG